MLGGGITWNRARQMLFMPSMLAYQFKGINIAASFGATLLLARVAGAAVVGDYSLAVSTGALIGMFALLGLNQILLREISGNIRQHRPAVARGTLDLVVRIVFISSLLIMAGYAAVVIFSPVTNMINSDHAAILFAVTGIIATTMFSLSLATMRGAQLPVHGQFLEGIPSVLFLGALAGFWLVGAKLSTVLVVLLFFASQLLTAVLGFLYLRPTIRSWGAPEKVRARPLYSAGIPIMLASAIHATIDWLLLAAISNVGTAAEVGAFRVAAQIMLLLAAIVATGESYIATYMAGDFRVGRPDLAWRKQWRATGLMLLLGGLPILICVVAPRQLLGGVFGPEFAVAGPSLVVMAIGQLVSLVCGPVGAFLVMAGKEKFLLWQAVVALGLAVALTVLLVPHLGLLGAAWAYSGTIIFRKVSAILIALWMVPRRPVTI